MRKIISNGIAFLRGSIFKLLKCRKKNIGKKVRLFKGTEIRLYKKSYYRLGNNLKVDEGALIVACPSANLDLGDNVGIGPQNRIICRKRIKIGKDTIMGPNVYIYDHDHKYNSNEGVDRFNYNVSDIVIGEKCWIGANVIILKGSHIGDRCLIAAGSVIKGNIPSGTVVIQKRENFFRQIGDLND